MLGHTISNKFITKNGIKYKFRGSRCSGEYTTSTENSIINYCMLATWLKSSDITNFKIIVNGDDSVVFIDRKDSSKVRDLSYFNHFNMETELDRISYDFNSISFCQCSPILVSGKYTMIKEPSRLISRSLYTSYQHIRVIDKLLSATGLCELACNQGVPILQEYALFLIKSGNLQKPLSTIDKIPARRSRNFVEVVQISDETRHQFSNAFGIPPWQQMQIESHIAGLLTIIPDCSVKNFINKHRNFILE